MASMLASNMHLDPGIDEQERKKRLKREANRRSAQLSRQRKKAFVEDLKAKNAEYQHARAVLRHHPDAIFALDGHGRVNFANGAAARTAGTPSGDSLRDRSFYDLLEADSRRRFGEALEEAARRPPRASVPLGGP
eukprot:CAMPEP_0119270730 /NCGR_PEP_ID=MMETSP1329-20130426/7615_1 /TAXON_ID=114041 /ORGANISM="Genus nov. species nov., Strain RCC1024" /LENGTH=134 /DNA_ID=CAMNT_0007270761 /DNA_START=209 /DNA_END=609 /DNA_ORIENTATION=-